MAGSPQSGARSLLHPRWPKRHPLAQLRLISEEGDGNAACQWAGLGAHRNGLRVVLDGPEWHRPRRHIPRDLSPARPPAISRRDRTGGWPGARVALGGDVSKSTRDPARPARWDGPD